MGKKKPTSSKRKPPIGNDLPAGGPAGFPIVGIGASAGGLEALEAFFQTMPADAGLGFILVVHLDPTHASILPELLQKHTKMPVRHVEDGDRVEPDHVYVIPPNKDLQILHGSLQLMEMNRPRGANMPIDTFFRCLAQDQKSNAVCIILSGTGTDGTLGMKEIKGEVGMAMVQDEKSAKYDGMPRSAVATGLADYVLAPDKMPDQLIKYTSHSIQNGAAQPTGAQSVFQQSLKKIFILLRTRTGHDFSLYKKNTILRRIERRMTVHQIEEIEDYVRYLQGSNREAGILFKELLIGVTQFFRDPAAFEILKNEILPKMLAGKLDDHAVRVWVPGCSSGEEAYSIAMVLHETMEAMGRHFHVQVFGTDLDEEAIGTARAGLYPESIKVDIAQERISRFFNREEDGSFRVKTMIREMLVFAVQSVTKDPPFTKLDLLSCRNLLIYLGAELQHKLLPIFHYSLRPDGILFLGSSETIGTANDLFAPANRKWKIFVRKPAVGANRPVLEFPAHKVARDDLDHESEGTVRGAEELSILQLVETILQQSDTPPCAIIDDSFNVVYIHGRTGRFLEPAEGKASVNIVEMARPELKKELAATVRQVARNKQESNSRGLEVDHYGETVFVDLTVRPILEHIAMRGLLMVVFEETKPPGKKTAKDAGSGVKRCRSSALDLERELRNTRESLQTTIEELETSNEELKSTNEELQSTNEELQSTNEELETSKEELQSLNEESATVNAELQSRIDELSNTHDDMKNLLDSTEIATVFLDRDLSVRRFTPRVTEIIPLTATDIGRPIKHLASSLVDADLVDYGEMVLDDLAVRSREVESKDGRYYLMKVRPYRTLSNVIDGVVVTFEDTTAAVLAKMQLNERAKLLEESETRIRLLLDSGDDVITMHDFEGRYLQYHGPGRFDLTGDIVIGKTVFDFFEPAISERILAQIREVWDSGESRTYKNSLDWQGERIHFVEFRYPVVGRDGKTTAVGTVGRNVTDLHRAEMQAQRKEERLRQVVEMTGDGVFETGISGDITFANSAYAEMFGYAVANLIGHEWTEYIHPDAVKSAAEFNKQLLSGSTIEGESVGVHVDGHAFEIHYHIRPLFEDGVPKSFLGTIKKAADSG